MEVLVCDDEVGCRDLMVEFLQVVSRELSVIETDRGHAVEEILKAREGIRLLILDFSAFTKGDLVNVLGALNSTCLRRAVVAFCTGYNYSSIAPELIGFADKLNPTYLSLFVGKPFKVDAICEVVRLAVCFAVDGDQIGSADIANKNVVLVGSGERYSVSSQSIRDIDLGGGLDELVGFVPSNDIISLSFTDRDVEILYEKIRNAFLMELGAAFSGGADVVRKFIGKVLDKKVSFVISSILAKYEGGAEVFNHIVHDLRHVVLEGDDRKFLILAGEHLKVLKSGFEKGRFVETVSVAEFFSCERFHFDGDSVHGRVNCSVDPSVCVNLPNGGMGFLIGNLLRNACKVAEDGFLENGDLQAFKRSAVDIDVTLEEGEVVIKMSDNVPRFPDEYIHDVFDRQLSTDGSGVALLNMANMMRRFGGSICLRQACPDGSVLVKEPRSYIRSSEVRLPDWATKQFEIRLPVVSESDGVESES